MSRQWVVNASPLIVLAKTTAFSLLTTLPADLVIPEGAAEEIYAGPEGDPAGRWLHTVGHRHIRAVPGVHPTVASWDLGVGESQVLTWAYENPGYEAIVDDRAARNCAAALGLPVRGTLGIILLGKKAGLLDDVEPVLKQVVDAGLRISPEVLEVARQLGKVKL